MDPRILTSKDMTVSPDTLKIAPDNPNEMSTQQFEALKESIRQYGILQPPVVDESTMIVIDGNHRVMAAQELKLPEIKIIAITLASDIGDCLAAIILEHHNNRVGGDLVAGQSNYAVQKI